MDTPSSLDKVIKGISSDKKGKRGLSWCLGMIIAHDSPKMTKRENDEKLQNFTFQPGLM